MVTVRLSTPDDKPKIRSLYQKVARISGGIARAEDEITDEYIADFMHNATLTGLALVVEHPGNPELIVAEMHGHTAGPKAFAHVLTNLTIAVDPDFQGQGVGKLMFTRFIEHIHHHRSDILRVELVTHESNKRALNLYKKLGFVVEGRLEKRIWFSNKDVEADIPLAWFNKNFRRS